MKLSVSPPDRADSFPLRGTSVTLNYVLTLGITTLLVTGLIVAGGSFVEEQRERVIEGELNVIGNHVAGNMEQIDRYVTASEGNTTAHIEQRFQRQVSGSQYTITVVEPETSDEPAQLELTAADVDATVTVNVTVSNAVAESTADGGAVVVEYDEDTDALVIDNG